MHTPITRRSIIGLMLALITPAALANNRGKTRSGGRGSSGKGGHYVSRPKSSSKKR